MNHFLSVLVLILITATTSHAILPPKVYWNIMLPNSPMPDAILDLLSSDGLVDEKTGTTMNVGKGGVGVNMNGKDNTQGGVAKGGITVNTGKRGGSGTNVKVGHGGVGVLSLKGKGNTQVGAGKGGVRVTPKSHPSVYNYAATETQTHDDPNVVAVTPKNPSVYNYAVTETQIHDNPNVAVTHKNPSVYNYAATETQTHDDPNVAAVTPKNPSVYNYAATETQIHHDPNIAVTRKSRYNYAATETKIHDNPNVAVTPKSRPSVYNYAATETQIHDNPNIAVTPKSRPSVYNYVATETQTHDDPNVAVTPKSRPSVYNYAAIETQIHNDPKVAVTSKNPSVYNYAATETQIHDDPNVVVTPKSPNSVYNYAATETQIYVDPNMAVTPKSPSIYNYAATETPIHHVPNVGLFFLEKDLSPGSELDLRFIKTTSGSPFISRSQANTIPFSSNKLPEILTRFQVEPSSVEAEAMKNTLADCEGPAMRGESKFCATSLESMVEFSMLSLGTRDVQAISTKVSESRDAAEKQQYYSVAPPGAQAMAGEKLVACHAQPYGYAVFYCHATSKSKAYKVPLVGKDGTKVEAMAVCHLDTTAWNPKYMAFQVLKVKPGTVPVCHFLPEDHVVWSVRK